MYQESAATNITEGRATDYASEEKPNTYYKEVLVKTNKWSLVLTKLLDPTANLQQIQGTETIHYTMGMVTQSCYYGKHYRTNDTVFYNE